MSSRRWCVVAGLVAALLVVAWAWPRGVQAADWDEPFVVRPGRDLRLVVTLPGVYGLEAGETYYQAQPLRTLPRDVSLVAVGEGPPPRVVAPNGFLNHDRGRTRNLTIRGLHITPVEAPGQTREPGSPRTGIRVVGGVEGLTIEGSVIEGFKDNIAIQAMDDRPVRDVTIRGNVIRDAWATEAHSQGLFVNGVEGLRVEGNVFRHNGWNETHPAPSRAKFNHEAYVADACRDVVIRGNVFADAASDAVQLRPGGVLEGNLFVRCPIAGFVGGPAESVVRDNLVLLATNGVDGRRLGWGLAIGENPWSSPGALVEGNVAALRLEGAPGVAALRTQGDQTRGVRYLNNAADGTWPAVTEGAPDEVTEERGTRRIEVDAQAVRHAAEEAVAAAAAGEIGAAEAIARVREALGLASREAASR